MVLKLKLITSPNCSPCMMLKDRLTKDNIDYQIISVEEAEEQGHQIMSIPVMLITENDELVERIDGFSIIKYNRMKQMLNP